MSRLGASAPELTELAGLVGLIADAASDRGYGDNLAHLIEGIQPDDWSRREVRSELIRLRESHSGRICCDSGAALELMDDLGL